MHWKSGDLHTPPISQPQSGFTGALKKTKLEPKCCAANAFLGSPDGPSLGQIVAHKTGPLLKPEMKLGPVTGAQK